MNKRKYLRWVRTLLSLWVIGACTVASVAQTQAQAQAVYPSKPIRLIITNPAGGLPDTVARLFAQRLSERFGQPAVVDNKPGANGVVVAQALATSLADGHTFMVTDGSMFSINPVIYKNPSYDYKRDFVPVALAARASLYLAVHPKGGVANLQEFIALVKAKPGTLKYGLSGIGSTHHLTMEVMKSGQIKLLANNAAQRSSQEPQVPTSAELIQALNSAGVDAVGAGPADYGRAIQSEIDRMAKAIATAQIKSE